MRRSLPIARGHTARYALREWRMAVFGAVAVVRAAYDPVTKRYRATCPHCGYVAVRAKRESAEHTLSLHVIHTCKAHP